MFVDNKLREILDIFFDGQDDLTLSPFIKILFDEEANGKGFVQFKDS